MSDFVKIMHKAVAGSLVILAGVFVACEKDSADKSVAENSEYPRAETLYIGGFDWAPPTTFNPLDYDPNFPIDGNVRLMYETLVTYNQITDKLEPMLADSFTRTDSSIVVHLDKNAKWNNGTPVTVDDVIYSFHIDSILPTPRHGNWEYLTSVTADNSNNITFLFNKKNKNPLIILNAIAETSILPKSVFEPIIEGAKEGKAYNFGKVVEFKNDNSPVVSGPYNLKTFSPDLGIEGMDVTLWSSNNYIKDEITEVTDFDGVTLSKYVRAKAYSRMMGVAYSNIDKRNLDHILCLVRDDFFPISSKMFSDSFNELFASDDRETRVLNVRDWVSRIFKDPLHDDCIICVDLYNQIVAGVLAGLCGNPDLYPSLYRGSDYSLFIPNESSSKEGFEEGYANPTAAIVSAAMILSDLGMRDASRKVTDALSGTYVAGERTPDVGGTLTTEEFTQRVISRL